METPNRTTLGWIGLTCLAALVLSLAAFDLLAKPRLPLSGSPSATSSLLLASSSQARITWSPPRPKLALSLGERRSTDVVFTSSRALTNATLQIVPLADDDDDEDDEEGDDGDAGSIVPYVAIEPTSFASIPAGQSQTVHLSFTVPAGATLGKYKGRVRITAGTKKLKKKLKLSLTIFDDAVPPPDPGDAGKATLAGIDSDSDGVRDDVQRYIALTFPDSRKTRAALRQIARTMQASVLDAGNEEASMLNILAVFRGKECLSFLRQADAISVSRELAARFLDTALRSEAWIAAGQHFSGETYSLPSIDERKASCNFDVDSMVN